MPAKIFNQLAEPLHALKVLGGSGIIQLHSPIALAEVVLELPAWGTGLAGGFTAAAKLHAKRPAIIDELGSLTFREVAERSNALAHSLAAQGVAAGDSVALLVRNHRGFLDASLALAKLGADILYMNTAFSGPQLAEVCAREGAKVIIFDQEFTELLTKVDPNLTRILAWTDTATTELNLESLIKAGDTAALTPPQRKSRVVILTSGTTGTPKGAPRPGGHISAAVALLSRMPFKARWKCHIAAPLFHTWGWGHLNLAMLLGTTVVLRRHFDPKTCMEVVSQENCDSLVVIPVMLQRILNVPEAEFAGLNFAKLKGVASSGSALPGKLATEWMDRFGDNLYNIYGSTEVAWVSIADPADLRLDPATSGRPPRGTVVKLLDENDQEVPVGQTGRIFVSNSMLFEGYTGGGHKQIVAGLMSSGDVGRFDHAGLLYVEGRDDDMIVSGGENVFPQEVENVLASHPQIIEVAAVGVDDAEFGKRLRVFVVQKDESLTADDVKAFVKANLARYKVPREVVFLPELPRNATGKILKRDLAKD